MLEVEKEKFYKEGFQFEKTGYLMSRDNGKYNFKAYAVNVCPDQPTHSRTLAKTFAMCWHILQYSIIIYAFSKGPAQAALSHD